MKVEKYVSWVAMIICVDIFFAAGFAIAQDMEAKALEDTPNHPPSPGAAAQYYNIKYASIGIGVVIEVFFVFWLWRMTRVERAKYELIKLILSGKMSVEEAAKKLGVSREVVKDAVKELKEEGAVE